MINLPSAGTPTQSHQELSTILVPLKISTPGSSHSKFAKLLHYGDAFLDENIIIPQYSATMTLDEYITSYHRKEEVARNNEKRV